jgi:hypothetical protein
MVMVLKVLYNRFLQITISPLRIRIEAGMYWVALKALNMGEKELVVKDQTIVIKEENMVQKELR